MKIRWNSMYKMVNRFLTYRHVLDQLHEHLDTSASLTDKQRKILHFVYFSGVDWNVIQAIRRVLERFPSAITTFRDKITLHCQCLMPLYRAYLITFILSQQMLLKIQSKR